MSQDFLTVGEKVHIITRRLFEEDLRRHFVGECTVVADNHARIVGYAFVFDPSRNEYLKRPERRTRLFPLADAGLIITVLPAEVDIEHVKYVMSNGRLVLSDGGNYELDINEFGFKN